MLENLKVTKDESDNLWHMTRIYVSDDDISFWEENPVSPTLVIDSMCDVLRVFINGNLIGSITGHWVKNYGTFLENNGAGFRGQTKLTGFKIGDIDHSKASWTYQGLLMENLFEMSYRDASGIQQLILVVALISTFNHWELMNEIGAGLMTETYKLKGFRNNEKRVAIWVALLLDCCTHDKSSIEKMVAKMVLELNPDNLEIHALVSKFFAKENMWDGVSSHKLRFVDNDEFYEQEKLPCLKNFRYLTIILRQALQQL
ncbi:hypothetical protein V6N13_105097 [Hibiscus sabdariffa]